MISFPNSKINLGLYIENKRPDGFHNIKTAFFPLPLIDVLEIIESQDTKFSMTMSGIPVNIDLSSNLCFKAYDMLRLDFNLPAVKIHLHKAIPHGAGLGGGSADAAFTIKMLNTKFNLNLSIEQMQQYAANLGSDSAFFIENKAIIAKGKGNIFEKTDFTLEKYYILLIKPEVCVNTAEAYKWVRPRNIEINIESILKQPIETWKTSLVNDFEESVFKKFPVIASFKNLMYENEAIYAAMSGSGAAVYGIFKEKPKQILFSDNCFCWGTYIN